MRSILFLALVFLAPCVAGKRLRELGQTQLASSQGVSALSDKLYIGLQEDVCSPRAQEECKACVSQNDRTGKSGGYCNVEEQQMIGKCVESWNKCSLPIAQGGTAGKGVIATTHGCEKATGSHYQVQYQVVEVTLDFKNDAAWNKFFGLENHNFTKQAGQGSLAYFMKTMATPDSEAAGVTAGKVAEIYTFMKDGSSKVTIRETYESAAQEMQHRDHPAFKAYAALKGAYRGSVSPDDMVIDVDSGLKNAPLDTPTYQWTSADEYPFSAYPAVKVWKDGAWAGRGTACGFPTWACVV